MTFSRRYAEQRAQQKHLRETITIGIFGSFATEYLQVLQEAQECLIDQGFRNVKLSSDLEQDNLQHEDESEDDYNLRLSDLLVDTSEIHIFFFFRQNDDPVNINESSLMELTAHRKTQNLSTAYLLIQDGARFAGVGRGTTGKYQYEDFDEYRTTFPYILKFCQKMVHEIIRSPE